MMNKKYTKKFKILENLYNLHDQYTKESFSFACEKGCAACCTCNVTMTSLETAYFFSHYDEVRKQKLLDQVRAKLSAKRYHPHVTTNGFAALCTSGGQIPEEENDPLWGSCPLLTDNFCPVYDARPFGCRSLVSEKNCVVKGYALISDWMLTINSIFMQVIEHIDASGVSGNLTDMILISGTDWTNTFSDQALSRHKSSFARLSSQIPGRCRESANNIDNHILMNQEAGVFMVPPEHRQKALPLLLEVNAIIK